MWDEQAAGDQREKPATMASATRPCSEACRRPVDPFDAHRLESLQRLAARSIQQRVINQPMASVW